MAINFTDQIKMKYQIFIYNFGWSPYVEFLDGPIAKFSYFLGFVGYLILFNDQVTEYFQFSNITSITRPYFILDGQTKIRTIYFGMVLLFFANLIYRIFRPWVLKYGRNEHEFSDYGIRNFTAYNYIRFNDEIRTDGHQTIYGKYYSHEWDEFLRLAIGVENKTERQTGNWAEAKSKFENLLRGICYEIFAKNDIKRRKILFI